MRWPTILFLLVWCCAATAQPLAPLVLQPEQARLLTSFAGLNGPGTCLVSLADEGALVAGGRDGQLHCWFAPQLLGVRGGNDTPLVIPAHQGPIVALGSDGHKTLVSAGADHKVHVWSLTAGMLRQSIAVAVGQVRCLAVSSDGKTLATAGDNPGIQLWDLATGQPTGRLEGHRDWVMALAFSADGKYLASAGYEATLRVWNLGTTDKLPQVPFRLPVPPDRPQHALRLAFNPGGDQVAVGCSDGAIHLVNPANGAVIRTLAGHGSSITGLAFHPTAPFLLSSSKDRTLKVWNLANGQAAKTLEGHEAWVQGLALLQQGALAGSVSADGTVKIWDLRAAPK